jgi:hypothetical protein
MTKKITFYPTPDYIKEDRLDPKPARFNIPQWYKDITLYNKSNSPKDARIYNENTGVDGSALSVKICTPFYDAMSAGYHYLLPEDVEISLDEKGIPKFKWDSNYFIINRLPAVEIPIPNNCHPIAFSFRMMYGVELPEGCSLLITPVMNRWDLPYTVPFGIVDADTKFAPLDIRFFLRKDFEGILKKGTPIFQVIPFTRESWEMNVDESITMEKMWLHEKRRTLLSGWYTKEAHKKKEFN